MLPARRRQLVRTWVAAFVVAIGAWLVARWCRAIFWEQPFVLPGESGLRYWEAARTSFARGQGFPLWDRSHCGGVPLLGNPEASVVSSIFAGVFGVHGDVLDRWYPTVGIALGIVGTYAWCRRVLELGRLGSFYAGAILAASGFLGLQIAVRMHYVPFLWIPWALYFARIGEKDVRGAAAAGAVVAMMVLEGGFLPALMAIVAIVLTSGPRFLSRQAGLFAVSRLFFVGTAAFVLLAGVKLYPDLVQLFRYPKLPNDHDQLKWVELLPMFIDKERFDGLGAGHYHWNEYRAYIGPIATGMAIAGAGTALILKPRRWGLAILLLGGLLLTRGRYSDAAPFALLTKLPVYSQLQVPSRFVVLALIAMAAAGGVALDWALEAAKGKRIAQLIIVGVACLAVWDGVVEGRKILKASGAEPWLPRPDPTAGVYHLVPGEDYGRAFEYPARNVGTPACFRVWDHPEARELLVGDRPQAYVDAPELGNVASVDVKQNEYAVGVTMARAGVLHLNTTYDLDWTTSVGEVQASPKGALDVLLPAGMHTLTVRYRPQGLTSGLVATILGALGFLMLLVTPFVRRAWQRRAARSRPYSTIETSPKPPPLA